MLTFTTITKGEALDLILRGLQAKRAEIEEHLRDLRAQLNGHEARIAMFKQCPGCATTLRAEAIVCPACNWEQSRRIGAKGKRKRSAATRARMAAAQRARWAKVKGA